MRFALVTAHYQPASVACGVGDYARYLRQALERIGHECVIVTSSSSRSEEKAVYRVDGRWGVRDLLWTWRILRAVRPDVTIVQYTPEQYGYGVVFKLLPLLLRVGSAGSRTVTVFHTLVGGRWMAKVSAVLLAAFSDATVSVHRELSELYRRRLPWWAGKLREIPIGANIPRPDLDRETARRELRRQLGLPVNAVVLGIFGFPAPGKGFETLFRALSLLNESSSVHLACIGETRVEDRPHRAVLEAMARNLGISGQVHWMGARREQEVANLLHGVEAYVVPYDDGASLRRGTLMAGFQAGVPVVTTVPRYPDPSLSHGETVLSVPAGASDELARSLRRLLDDPALQEQLRQAAERTAGKFGWNSIAARFVEMAQQVCSRARQCA